MATNPSFMNGVPELLILRTLEAREMYGYELVQAIQARTNQAIKIGEGVVYPALHALEARYPDVSFLGVHTGEGLANLYASSDVFVFPSRTDTFGIVLLEALASGLPIAAYDVTGPADVFADGIGIGRETNCEEVTCRASA